MLEIDELPKLLELNNHVDVEIIDEFKKKMKILLPMMISHH